MMDLKANKKKLPSTKISNDLKTFLREEKSNKHEKVTLESSEMKTETHRLLSCVTRLAKN